MTHSTATATPETLIPRETKVHKMSAEQLLDLVREHSPKLEKQKHYADDHRERWVIKHINSLLHGYWQHSSGNGLLNLRNEFIAAAFKAGLVFGSESCRELSYDVSTQGKKTFVQSASVVAASALRADDLNDHTRGDLLTHFGSTIIIGSYIAANKSDEIQWADIINSEFDQNEQGEIDELLRGQLDAQPAETLVDCMEQIMAGSPANTMIRYLLGRSDVTEWLSTATVVLLVNRRMVNSKVTKAERMILDATLEHLDGKAAFALVRHTCISPTGKDELIEKHAGLGVIRKLLEEE